MALEPLFTIVDVTILNRLRRSTNWAGRNELRATAITSTSLSLHFEHYPVFVLYLEFS